ncbi:MAG: hypothetical protein WCX65_08145 [bacterium]
MKTKYLTIIFLCLSVAVLLGCARGRTKTSAGLARPAGSDIRADVVRKISSRVIGDIPSTGRLETVKKRGILRVALPPQEPPFQSLDPAMNLPVGFNTALVSEIALILEVKPNITILERQPDLSSYPTDWADKYDLIFLDGPAGACPRNQGIAYFYNGAAAGWKTICAADPNAALSSAVKEILVYLNETGIFAQLYRTHVIK